MTARACSYAIVGKRADVWPVAAMLARQLPEDAEISVTLLPGGVEEPAVVPLADPYFAALDIEAEALARAGARFALGYSLEEFAGEGSRMIAAPSGDLPAIGGLAFHHILHRVAAEAEALDRFAELYEGFRFCARAATQGRMALPEDAPDSPLAMLGPLAVIERERLADVLEATLPAGRVAEVDDRQADFVIDLQARESDEATLNIPCLAHSQIIAEYDGLPTYRLQDGSAETFAIADPWRGNRIRLGPACAAMGPMFSADARLLLLQVMHLVECLPSSHDAHVEARRFNRLHRRSVQRLYEMCAAPIALGRKDCPGDDMLEGLALRIDQFRSRGHLPELEGEIADRQFWIDLMICFGVVPTRHDRRADALDARQLDRALGTIRGQLEQSLAAMPTMERFLQRFGDS